ncbi:NUDIX domain protein [Enhygromyxa salina]|uniref:NUDIX domain protein n=1 Tax=Enhygromyxa salina TaxID=215803 RepID=A0A2S9YBX3_9BACT|nr:NUDIX domain-containing protein [Enhygromyxa salina]PRQ02511.1 NUDIX domain protein [Enhygromyxa salina]
MAAVSAGLLLCRVPARLPVVIEFLLVHPGGPFFANKDAGAWSIPKGLVEPGEQPLATAQREFVEETGFPLPPGPYLALGEIVQKGGKRVLGFAALGDANPSALVSNTFELEWPPRSGRRAQFPEVDRAQWLEPAAAQAKINAAQIPLLERASTLLTAAARS